MRRLQLVCFDVFCRGCFLRDPAFSHKVMAMLGSRIFTLITHFVSVQHAVKLADIALFRLISECCPRISVRPCSHYFIRSAGSLEWIVSSIPRLRVASVQRLCVNVLVLSFDPKRGLSQGRARGILRRTARDGKTEASATSCSAARSGSAEVPTTVCQEKERYSVTCQPMNI